MPSNTVSQFIGEVESPKPRYIDVVNAASRIRGHLHAMRHKLNIELASLPPCPLKTQVERVLRELAAINLSDEDDELEIFSKATGHTPKSPTSTVSLPTTRQLKATITRGTGLSGWKVIDNVVDNIDDIVSYFSDYHEVVLTPDMIKQVTFSRDFDLRSELNYIHLALTPVGIFVIDAQTDHASGFSDFVSDLKGLESWLGKL